MKYPKLWNGSSPVGEALVRALQMTGAPYLSARTADGVYAGVMDGKGEVKQQGGEECPFVATPSSKLYGAGYVPEGEDPLSHDPTRRWKSWRRRTGPPGRLSGRGWYKRPGNVTWFNKDILYKKVPVVVSWRGNASRATGMEGQISAGTPGTFDPVREIIGGRYAYERVADEDGVWINGVAYTTDVAASVHGLRMIDGHYHLVSYGRPKAVGDLRPLGIYVSDSPIDLSAKARLLPIQITMRLDLDLNNLITKFGLLTNVQTDYRNWKAYGFSYLIFNASTTKMLATTIQYGEYDNRRPGISKLGEVDLVTGDVTIIHESFFNWERNDNNANGIVDQNYDARGFSWTPEPNPPPIPGVTTQSAVSNGYSHYVRGSAECVIAADYKHDDLVYVLWRYSLVDNHPPISASGSITRTYKVVGSGYTVDFVASFEGAATGARTILAEIVHSQFGVLAQEERACGYETRTTLQNSSSTTLAFSVISATKVFAPLWPTIVCADLRHDCLVFGFLGPDALETKVGSTVLRTGHRACAHIKVWLFGRMVNSLEKTVSLYGHTPSKGLDALGRPTIGAVAEWDGERFARNRPASQLPGEDLVYSSKEGHHLVSDFWVRAWNGSRTTSHCFSYGHVAVSPDGKLGYLGFESFEHNPGVEAANYEAGTERYRVECFFSRKSDGSVEVLDLLDPPHPLVQSEYPPGEGATLAGPIFLGIVER